MNPYIVTAPAAWQESWDRQQEAFMPDREHRLAAVLDAVDATVDGGAPRVLDLAGGTGTIALRTLARFPAANVTLLDVDPVLLAIASASLAGRAQIATADLRGTDWRGALPERETGEGYNAVLTSTALHWLAAERLTALYAEIREILRPGGIFVNADHMPDEGIPGLTERLHDRAGARRTARYAAGAALSWPDWWDRAGADAELGPLVEERKRIYPAEHSSEWLPPASWHLAALRGAGFTEAGIVWRGGSDAAVAAVR